MRKAIVLCILVVGTLIGSAVPASAVIHVTVPADDCAPDNAQAVSNDTFEAQIQRLVSEGILSLPLGGFKQAPTTCPAD
jgi:hypothetical protein